ncbi:MAG: hypothetical protein R3C17_18055 [Planctomycetaceae bacterium]
MPTALEWTAAILGAVQLTIDAEPEALDEHRTWFDAGQPTRSAFGRNRDRRRMDINFWWPQVNSVAVIVKKDIDSDGKRFDLSHQQLAPPAFRSSELSFRVVAELQAMTTKESKEPEPVIHLN